jgi:hypothetical protein
LQACARQKRASRIADQDGNIHPQASIKKCRDALREIRRIKQIANQNDIDAGRRSLREIVVDRHKVDRVRSRVQAGRHDGVTIDIRGDHLLRCRLGGGDADKSGAGAKIEDATTGNDRGMIENVTREREAAAPRISPIGRGKIIIRFGQPPQAAARTRPVQANFRYGRHDCSRKVGLDETIKLGDWLGDWDDVWGDI